MFLLSSAPPPHHHKHRQPQRSCTLLTLCTVLCSCGQLGQTVYLTGGFTHSLVRPTRCNRTRTSHKCLYDIIGGAHSSIRSRKNRAPIRFIIIIISFIIIIYQADRTTHKPPVSVTLEVQKKGKKRRPTIQASVCVCVCVWMGDTIPARVVYVGIAIRTGRHRNIKPSSVLSTLVRYLISSIHFLFKTLAL